MKYSKIIDNDKSKLFIKGVNKMLDNSLSYCINEKCSKKDKCLRFREKKNINIGETYFALNEEECSKNNCYINKNEYYKKMILDVIEKEPKDNIDSKFLLNLGYSLLKKSEGFNLDNKLKQKIKNLENSSNNI